MDKQTIFHELDPIFHPESVALIGASAKEAKIGRVFMDRFLEMGFQGLYPVNPNEREILGLKAYPSILDIPEHIDMAFVVTPPKAVLQAVKEAIAKRVRVIVIVTSGFAEAGSRGKELQDEIARIVRKEGIRILGPNCIGIYCPASRLPFTLGQGKTPGSVGVVSQSGFFADYLTHIATANGIAFSKGISCGNEADLCATDFFEYLGEDPETKSIVAYVEGIREGRRFYTILKEVSQKKPVILWKGGITAEGALAAASHTGALAGSRQIWNGALRQAGVISVNSFEEVLDSLYALHLQPLPDGRRVGIISAPGGMAVAATDACLELGLEVPQFSPTTVEKLRKMLPIVGGSARNPVDLSMVSGFNPRFHGEALQILVEEKNVDMLLLISATSGKPLCQMISDVMMPTKVKKPLAVTVMKGTQQSVMADFPLLLENGISVYMDAARAVRALSRLWEYAKFRKNSSLHQNDKALIDSESKPQTCHEARDIINSALIQGRFSLSEHESKEVLRAWGIPVNVERLAHSRIEFKKALSEIGFPVVIKAGAQDLSHKTDRGLVYVNIRNEQEAVDALMQIEKILSDESPPVLVGEMIKGSREIVVGLIRDKQFGPCVMFGLGGILTEALKDNTFRVAPVSYKETLAMFEEIRARDILKEFRGMPPADLDSLARIIMKVGQIGLEHEEIREIDINPVILSDKGPVAVDALIVLDSQKLTQGN